MDNGSITNASLQQLYRKPIEKTTGIFSAGEVEEAIQTGKQINQEQLDVLNNYWQAAGSQKIQVRPTQKAVEGLSLQTRENVGFFTKLKNKFFGRFAKKSAQGNPVQEQASQKFTVKQKEADRVRDKIARRHNPYADHVSYKLLRQLDAAAQGRENTVNAAKKAGLNVPDTTKDSSRYRTFSMFVHGFRADKDGNPLTKQDAQLKEENLAWARKYLSEDKEEHFSALDQIVDEILNFNITPATLKDTYIIEHFAEMDIFCSRITSIEELVNKDVEINQTYFREAIEPQKKVLFDARLDQLTALVGNTVNHCGKKKGFNRQERAYLDASGQEMKELIDAGEETLQGFNPEENFRQIAKKEKMVAEFEKRVGKQETKIKKQLSKQSKETKENKTNVGIAASDAARVRTFVSDIDERIAENPQMAERYKTSVDKLYAQIKKESNLRDEAGIQIAACAELQKEIADRKKKGKNVTPEEEEMGDLARRQENFLRVYRENQHVRNIAICGNAIRFFLTGEKLGDDALKLIKRLGLNDDLTGKNEELILADDDESTGGRI